MNSFDRRQMLRMGIALPTAAAFGFPTQTFAQSAGKGPINANIFCHTMGTPADVAQFTQISGVSTNVSCWVSNTDIMTKLASGAGRSTDLMNINCQFINASMKRGLLAPIDLTQVPNAKELAPFFSDATYNKADGKTYSVPFQFGYDTIVYNRKKLGEIDTYGALFDEKNKGQVSLRDDPQQSMYQTALFLGHKDPQKLTSAELAEVTKFLISKKPIFRSLWTGYAEAVSLLRSGEVTLIGDGWISMAWALTDGGKNSDFALAKVKEKAIVWTHDWIIPKEAETRSLASTYAFINWSLGADQAANMGRKVGYVSPSTAGLKVLTPAEAKTIGYEDYADVYKNGYLEVALPDNYSEWVEAWNRFKAA